MTRATNPVHETAVEAFFLQKYRMFLFRIAATRVFYRLIYLAGIVFLVVIDRLPRIQGVITCIITLLLGLFWVSEQISLNIQVREIEERLAERSGGEWEDTYIKSRYSKSEYHPISVLIYNESLIWTLVAVGLAMLRMFQVF